MKCTTTPKWNENNEWWGIIRMINNNSTGNASNAYATRMNNKWRNVMNEWTNEENEWTKWRKNEWTIDNKKWNEQWMNEWTERTKKSVCLYHNEHEQQHRIQM